MPHMVPDYYFGKMWVCEDCESDVCVFPWDLFTRKQAEEGCDGPVELSEEGWWERASAPGYLDATSWGGPYPTESDARRMVADDGFHPDTGEPYDDMDDPEVEEDVARQPLTERDYRTGQRVIFDKIMRERFKAGVGPAAGGDYYFNEPKRVPIKREKTEGERLLDFFFPKRRGSYLMNLKSWGR